MFDLDMTNNHVVALGIIAFTAIVITLVIFEPQLFVALIILFFVLIWMY